MDGELITTSITYNQGRVIINTAFSGMAQFAGISSNIVVTGASYYVQSNDTTIVQTASSNITLPNTLNLKGRILNIKSYGSTFDVVPYAGGNIDGSLTGITLTPGQCITLQNGELGSLNWYITNYYV